MKLYGIKNCDSVRKAVRFFKEHNIDFETVDFRETPVGCDTIDRWLEKVAVKELFNSRSTTYRKLGLKDFGLDEAGMRKWLCKENTLVKRPVVETDDGDVIVGFDEKRYKERFL
ncbi:Spx/MgsR family RNA polymerase-binding regulatory protein [Hydrogenimonas sp. SS33]|uniref:arsenate reductase family protein n=1 Tax=Hydrogenimonas leucolamina TaxID=2954236 RepID=UPI00336C2E00